MKSRHILSYGLFLTLLASAVSGYGSWNKIAQFSGTSRVTACYFFDASTGIIGFDGNVNGSPLLRTTDGGITWRSVVIPARSNSTYVMDIWFKDSQEGWATLFTGGELWHTTDGGLTWKALNVTGNFSGVRATSSAIDVTDFGSSLYLSTNGGTAFSPTVGPHTNGLDFVDNLHGAASGFVSLFAFSADGGLTWQNAAGNVNEAFGMYGFQGTSIFVAAAEESSSMSVPSLIYRSSDFGASWSVLNTLPFKITGGIAGSNGALYIQRMDMTGTGLYRSLDSGRSWAAIGGPGNLWDTRIAAIGCTLYAFDSHGGVYKSTDAGIGVCSLAQDSITLAATLCDSTRMIHSFNNPHPGDSVFVLDARILDSTRPPVTTQAFGIDSIPLLPLLLTGDDSMGFTLHWYPRLLRSTAGRDSSLLRIITLDIRLNEKDTFLIPIRLIALETDPRYSSNILLHAGAVLLCHAVDTSVTIRNLGCDTLWIESDSLNSSSSWSLTDSFGTTRHFPIGILPDSVLRLPLQFQPNGSGPSVDTLTISMRYFMVDSLCKMFLQGSGIISNPLIAPLAVAFDSVATCLSSDTVIIFKDSGCASLLLLSDSVSGPEWTLLDINGKPLTFPVTIKSDSGLPILIQFHPSGLGKTREKIAFHFTYFDSIFTQTITLSGIGKRTGTVLFARKLDFSNTSICSARELKIPLKNETCDAAVIQKIQVLQPFTWLDSLPATVLSGDTFELHARYAPQTSTKDTEYAIVSLTVNGSPVIDTLLLTGSGVGEQASLLASVPGDSIFLPTRSECDPPDSIVFYVFNPGCDSLLGAGVGFRNGGVDSPYVPYYLSITPSEPLVNNSLPSGDSIRIAFTILDSIAGRYTGNYRCQFIGSDGLFHDSTFHFIQVITHVPRTLTLDTTLINLGAMKSCETHDTTISYTNTSCVPVIFDSWRMEHYGDGFQVYNINYQPITIPAGETDSLHITFDGTHTGAIYDTVIVIVGTDSDSVRRIAVETFVPTVDSVDFVLRMPAQLTAGTHLTAEIFPDRSVSSNKGLSSISGELRYPDNDFAFDSITPAAGLQLHSVGPNLVNAWDHVSFFVSNSAGISLDPTKPIARLSLESMLTDTVAYTIQLDSIRLNDGDPQYANCTLASNGSSYSAQFSSNCGDSLIIGAMNDRLIILATGPTPNPVNAETGSDLTHFTLQSYADGMAIIELFDALGRSVSREDFSVKRDEIEPYSFDFKGSPAGSYFYTIRFFSSLGTVVRGGSIMVLR